MQTIIDKLVVSYEKIECPNPKGTLLILPGWMSTSAEWLFTAKSLAGTYTVVVLDFPGFGQTQPPTKSWDTYDYTNFVDKFAKKIGISSCVLLGHSFGGRVAIILTSRANWIEKLILVDAAGISEKKLITSLLRIFVSIAKPFSGLLPKKTRLRIRQKIGSSDYNSAGAMKKTLVRVIHQNLKHLLGKITAPTLVVWGDKDNVVEVRDTKTFKKEIRNSLVRIIWGAGHKPHLDKPEKFVEILKEFI